MRKLILLIILFTVPSMATVVTDVQKTGVAAVSWTSGCTVTLNGGGTLVYTTDYCRYALLGNLMLLEFSVTQTTAGSGTTDITIDNPVSGTTFSDATAVGVASSFDLGNDNVNDAHVVESVNSSNVLKIMRRGAATYIRGGTFIGNSGVENVSVSATIPLE